MTNSISPVCIIAMMTNKCVKNVNTGSVP